MSGRAISRRSAIVTTLGFVLAPPAAGAQDSAANFPNHPIRVIVKVPAGGGVDTITRIVADKMRRRIRAAARHREPAGAGGNVARRDGLLFRARRLHFARLEPASITTNQFLYKKLGSIRPSSSR